MAPIPLTALIPGPLQSLARDMSTYKRTTLFPRLNTPSLSSLTSSFLTTSKSLSPALSPSASRQRREQMISIPSTYTSFTSSPGAVVGIVIGTVGGFVLLIWILFLIFGGRTAVVDDATTVTEDTRPPYRSQSSHRRRPEVIEVMSGTTSTSQSEDVVEVYEEMSDHHSPRRTYSKRSGSYRTVDPHEYGGGRGMGRRVR
ncbi:hypothetical protein AJ79_05725 [Helicocarpus griseus UAMH5409]|uniref:Uncharacterized protein n=1 Tax=Helicocarpus griseus UAMH5409 TaxID=1447875 RepID=A0A2B7XJA1_9EURO|nr:hypothetical protein AJ79_05725 [Helicocarpus griseus UAMH5409]